MIEFQLEDDISDTDALKLIHSSYDDSKQKESKNTSHNSNTLILEEKENLSVDPFTYKLMNYEVNYLIL